MNDNDTFVNENMTTRVAAWGMLQLAEQGKVDVLVLTSVVGFPRYQEDTFSFSTDFMAMELLLSGLGVTVRIVELSAHT